MPRIQLDDKVALVTGGGSGIGRAIAELLARKKTRVAICGRNIAKLNSVGEAIRGQGGACLCIAADVTREEDVQKLVAEVSRTYGRIDILVNNAGIGLFRSFIDSTSADWDNVMDTNLRGAFLCAKACAPAMVQRGKGWIINIASGAGRVGIRNLSLYCASKAGLIGLTRAARMELGPLGIDVYCLFPGYVKTSFFDHLPGLELPFRMKMPEAIATLAVRSLSRRRGRQLKEKLYELSGRLLG